MAAWQVASLFSFLTMKYSMTGILCMYILTPTNWVNSLPPWLVWSAGNRLNRLITHKMYSNYFCILLTLSLVSFKKPLKTAMAIDWLCWQCPWTCTVFQNPGSAGIYGCSSHLWSTHSNLFSLTLELVCGEIHSILNDHILGNPDHLSLLDLCTLMKAWFPHMEIFE